MTEAPGRDTASDSKPEAPKCGGDTTSQLNSVDILKDAAKKPVYIGDATMDKDGTINLNLRQTADGTQTFAHLHYKPDNKMYQEVYCHLGGIKPGETKLVTPFADPSDKKPPAPAVKR